MGYTVKWEEENLGVTRKALRYYEKENLITAAARNSANNYRDYSEDDINRIWGIKLLIGIGYSAKEIYLLMNDPTFNFYESISEKVAELEEQHDKSVIYLQFAKSIKLTGLIPTTNKVGSIRFDDFLEYCHNHWNFYDDPKLASFMSVSDNLISKTHPEWSPEDIESVKKMTEDTDAMFFAYALHGYYQVISDMRDLGYQSEIVQRVVRLLHEYFIKHNTEPEFEGKITPLFFAKYTVPFFLNGDIAALQARNYGEEGCAFIASAIAYYGGYESADEV